MFVEHQKDNNDSFLKLVSAISNYPSKLEVSGTASTKRHKLFSRRQLMTKQNS
jgi:hypothetical protein